jgi:hypothetical protein
MIKKEEKKAIQSKYTYLKGSKGQKNISYNKDLSFYNFDNNLTESNKHLEGIKLMILNTPPHKKTPLKVYKILNSYDDNLIKGMNKDRVNKNRQIRVINEENNIHSFGEFKKSYQNETYSKENVHGFETKENKKLEILEEKNKFFYFKNETNIVNLILFLVVKKKINLYLIIKMKLNKTKKKKKIVNWMIIV